MKIRNLLKISGLTLTVFLISYFFTDKAFCEPPDDNITPPAPVRMNLPECSREVKLIDASDVINIANFISENYYEPLSSEDLLTVFINSANDESIRRNKPLLVPPPVADTAEYRNMPVSERIKIAIKNSGMTSEELQPFLKAGITGMAASLNDKGCKFSLLGTFMPTLRDAGYNQGGCGFFADEKPDSEGRYVVLETLGDFPAEKEGIMPGDLIVQVDKKTVKGLSFLELAGLIRGPVGTSVLLTIYRPSDNSERDVLIKRTWLSPNNNSLRSRILPEGVGYVKFRFLGVRMSFTLRDVCNQLKNAGCNSFIWDMRNSAGELRGGIDLAYCFVPENQIYLVRVFRKDEEVFRGSGNPPATAPKVILINKNTSPSCTLLALVMKKFAGSVLVGESTVWETDLVLHKTVQDAGIITVVNGYYKLPGGHNS